jgi:hypothetical protein
VETADFFPGPDSPHHCQAASVRFSPSSTLVTAPRALDSREHLERGARYLRSTNGRLIGRPPSGRYLLSGCMTCPRGARFEADQGRHWLGPRTVGVYVCAARRRKEPSVCTNNLALPITGTENMILDIIEGSVLAPSFVGPGAGLGLCGHAGRSADPRS